MSAAIVIQEVNVKKLLRIAEDLALPLDAVTQTLAAIGRKGAGKTYLATVIAEQMLDAGAQVVAVDPVGNWFGLCVGADGKSKGKEIFVLGGEHGHVPLTPEVGAKIARLVVEKRISAVLDVSSFRQGERKRFAADFAEELFHLKKTQRTPLHVFLEEAQLFAPQRPGPDDARMLGAFEHIVRLGRNYGIGCTLVTQRPQSVNKEVLSQVECLCVLQVTGPHERKALEEWVQEVGGERKLVGELPGLARGEGYVWSPSWLRTYLRVRFATKKTFDASATPEVGKAARTASLSTVDVEALRADLAEVVAAAEKDDPKALRRRIAELEREAAKHKAFVAEVDARTKVIDQKLDRVKGSKPVEVPVLKDAQIARLEKIVQRAEGIASRLTMQAAELRHEMARATRAGAPSPAAPRPAPPVPLPRRAPPAPAAARDARPFADGEDLRKGPRVVLTGIAQHGDEGVTREQISVLTRYKRSSRDKFLQILAAAGYVEQRGDRLVATAAGVATLGSDFEPLPTGAALLDHWRKVLPQGERVILDVAAESYPEPVDRERISEVTNYKRSSRDKFIQHLVARRLLTEPGRGMVRAAEALFS